MSKILGPISWAEYEKIPADVTKSRLVHMKKSPLHYIKQDELDREPSEEMELGTLLHTAILEPASLIGSYVVEPENVTIKGVTTEINRRVKAHREYLADFRKSNEGKIVIRPSHLDVLTGMIKAASEHRDLRKLMAMPGESEIAATWEHMGFKWKGRADRIIDHPVLGRTVIELKKTFDASPSGFSRQIYNLGYDVGIAAYMRGFEAKSYIFVCVESKAPFPIGIYRADDSMVERAHAYTDKLLGRLRKCINEDHFPGYTSDGEENLLFPGWVAALDNEEPDGF